ncbi:hypothetical protein [Phycicoccus avicenniae]|uniref:hypothetical protein n=1 Tax=Phycicoccus avicenniae TaxID=2828860 RepID=UPI003D2D5618
MTEPVAGSKLLTDIDEVLRRQVHPTRKDEVEGILFTAFQPTGDEGYLLSTLRGHVSAQECCERHQANGLQTMGSYGVAVGEAATIPMSCWDDGGLDGAPEDHASIDFRPLERKQRQRAARILRDAALARGCLYAVDEQGV